MPCIWAYADILVHVLDVCSKFKVMNACCSNSSHIYIGNFGCTDDIPATKKIEHADFAFSDINAMVVRFDQLVNLHLHFYLPLHICVGLVVHYVQLRFAVAFFEIVVHIFVDYHFFYIDYVFHRSENYFV